MLELYRKVVRVPGDLFFETLIYRALNFTFIKLEYRPSFLG
jgi:hypothetical protein